jgi:hypothetical protein
MVVFGGVTMQAVENDLETISLTLPKKLVDELRDLAKNRSLEAFMKELVVIYKSEALKRQWAAERFGEIVDQIQQNSVRNGVEMTMDEINEEIAAARREAALAKTA